MSYYKIIIFDADDIRYDLVEDKLNEWANKGWRVISIIPDTQEYTNGCQQWRVVLENTQEEI